MTYLLAEKAVSSFKDGIETVVVPVTHPSDLKDLVFHSQRGGIHDVVEWLLSQLYRSSEIDRVCGLTVTPLYEGVVQINLEMRQPGRQLEIWLEQWRNSQAANRKSSLAIYTGEYAITATVFEEGEGGEPSERIGMLVSRALSQEKFTDKHRPWWEKEIYLLPPSVTGEPIL